MASVFIWCKWILKVAWWSNFWKKIFKPLVLQPNVLFLFLIQARIRVDRCEKKWSSFYFLRWWSWLKDLELPAESGNPPWNAQKHHFIANPSYFCAKGSPGVQSHPDIWLSSMCHFLRAYATDSPYLAPLALESDARYFQKWVFKNHQRNFSF